MIGSGAGNAEDAARQRKWMAALTRASMPPRDTTLKSGPVSVSTVGLGHAKDEHITPSIIGTQGWSTRVPDARVGAHLSGIPDSTSALPRHEYRLRPHDVTAYCPPISPRRGTSTESFDAYFQRHLPDAPAEEAPPPASRGGRTAPRASPRGPRVTAEEELAMGWLENLSAEEIVRASRFGLLLPPKGEKRQPSATMQPGAYRPSAMLKFPS